MKAYKCDRCKTFYTREDADMYDEDITPEPELRMVWTNPKNNAYYNKVDLCPKCEQEMNNWFNLTKAQDVTFDKDGYANRIDLPWLRIDIYPPEDGEWGFFTDGALEGVGGWKHDAMDHLWPFYGPENFDHNHITHWCPLGKLPEKEI